VNPVNCDYAVRYFLHTDVGDWKVNAYNSFQLLL